MGRNNDISDVVTGHQESVLPIIRPLTKHDLEEYAEVIRQSFRTVAEDFGFTKENCPNHTSFITNERLANRYQEDYRPYGCYANDRLVGFASLTGREDGAFELNNLAVLPDDRHSGYGKALLDFCKEKVKEWGAPRMRLGMIAENERLEKWYLSHGFVPVGSQKFEQLPFEVAYMEWDAAQPR